MIGKILYGIPIWRANIKAYELVKVTKKFYQDLGQDVLVVFYPFKYDKLNKRVEKGVKLFKNTNRINNLLGLKAFKKFIVILHNRI